MARILHRRSCQVLGKSSIFLLTIKNRIVLSGNWGAILRSFVGNSHDSLLQKKDETLKSRLKWRVFERGRLVGS